MIATVNYLLVCICLVFLILVPGSFSHDSSNVIYINEIIIMNDYFLGQIVNGCTGIEFFNYRYMHWTDYCDFCLLRSLMLKQPEISTCC